MGISLSSLGSYVYYHYAWYTYGPNEWGTKPFELLYKGVGIHTLVDSYLCTTYEMKLHHLCILCILFYNEAFQAPLEQRFLFSYPMLNTEISSIFYVLKYWLPEKSKWYTLNLVLFYLSFIKFRLYDYYVAMIHQNALIQSILQMNTEELSSLLYLSVYGLYSLNLYWIFILNKVIYKTVFSSINTDLNGYSLTRHLYLANIPLTLYLYPVYGYECIGTLIHSLAAYLYHLDVYNRLSLKKIDAYLAPNKDSLLLYIVYLLSIHARSFFYVLTHYPYSVVAIFSGFLHEISLYRSICRVAELIDEEKKETFLKDQRYLLSLPFLVDGLWIMVHSSYDISVPLYLFYFTMIVVHIVNPFYKLTPVVFALGSMVQTYYMSLKFIQTY